MEVMQELESGLQESAELIRQQRYSDALNLVQRLRRTHQADRRLALRHGEALELNKQFDNALILYRNLAEALPKGSKLEAALVLGNARCLLRTAKYDEAEKLFLTLQAGMPAHAEVLSGLASCNRHKGRLTEAEALVRQALKNKPGNKVAVHELAELQIARQDDEAAIKTLEGNVFREDLLGDSLDLWLNTLKRLKRDRYTQDHLERLSKQFPEKVEFAFGVAVLAHRAGEISIARPALARADQLSPNNYRILHEWGVLERIAGNTARSQELLERSLKINPEQAAALRTFGTEHKYAYGDPEFTRLNYVAARLPEVPAIEQVHLHYALAKSFEDVSELDTAFRHYQIAGEKKLRLEPFDERTSGRTFETMRQVVSADTVEKNRQPGCDSETPVFILGMPRSGTSLLEQILSSHPDVFGAGELKFVVGVLDNMEIAGRRVGLGDPEPVFASEQNAAWKLRGQRYIEKLEKLADRPSQRIVDKMPGNFMIVGMIHAALPKARIIHSRRHPVETCLSNYRIHFAEGQLWSYNLRTLGRYYRQYWQLMKHWRQEFPDVMYEVRYEDNIADVETQARGLIRYLGLDWNENCLEFYNTDRPVKTASASQVKKPIYTTSTNRWRKFEKYLGPLLDEIGDIVEEYEAEIAHLSK